MPPGDPPQTPPDGLPDGSWNWTAPNPSRPDHLHIRWDGNELVLIASGSAEGSIAGRLGGVRLPKQTAVSLACWLLETGA